MAKEEALTSHGNAPARKLGGPMPITHVGAPEMMPPLERPLAAVTHETSAFVLWRSRRCVVCTVCQGTRQHTGHGLAPVARLRGHTAAGVVRCGDGPSPDIPTRRPTSANLEDVPTSPVPPKQRQQPAPSRRSTGTCHRCGIHAARSRAYPTQGTSHTARTGAWVGPCQLLPPSVRPARRGAGATSSQRPRDE